MSRFAFSALTIIFFHLTTLVPVLPESGQICIENRSGVTLLVIAEPNTGERSSEMLDSGKRLCAITRNGGTVRVFENEDALEGCSKLIETGQTYQLVSYASYDNCAWQEG